MITTAQLRANGASDRAIFRGLEAGRLHRLHRGVYAVGHARIHDERRWIAAVLAAGARAALSHTSAAHLWQIWRGPELGTHVVAPCVASMKHGLQAHRSRTLERRDVTSRRDIPVTSPERTLVDLADLLDVHQLVNVMHEAAYRKLLNERRVEAVIERVRGRPRLWIAEASLAAHRSGSAGTRSRLEHRFLALVNPSDLDVPDVNVRIWVAGKPIEVDFLWPRQKLCVETDGPGHLRPRIRADDAARDHLLRAHGFDVMRFTSADVEMRGQQVLAALHQRLGRGAK